MSDSNATKALLDAIASVELHLDSPALRMRAADYRARMSEIAIIAQLTHVLRDQPDSIEKHRTLGEALMWSGQTPVALLMEVFDESGMTDALNSHLDPIADGLARKDLPDEDVDFVRGCGSKDPESEILLALAHVRSLSQRQSIFRYGRLPPRGDGLASTVLTEADMALRDAAAKLIGEYGASGPAKKQASSNGSGTPSTSAKKRKIFNGIGRILTGVVGGTGNVLIGVGTIPVSGGASAAAVIASAAAALGFLMQGIGDLRGE